MATEYFTEYEKPQFIVKFMELQNKSKNLQVKADTAEVSKKKIEEERFQQEHARKPSEDRMHKNNTTET